MGKMISGAIILLASAILYSSHHLLVAILASGNTEVVPPIDYFGLLESDDLSHPLLYWSIAGLVIGLIIIVWGMIEKSKVDVK
ncbi:hypothetical protein [Shouchella shacheensis]|uniref:hypothetical protein n=1 Tax=Shouchella shacheensis TaxID=1649580 RepID=UPI00073FE02A|nr:hypothetical protein [Shouchella shacheensis]